MDMIKKLMNKQRGAGAAPATNPDGTPAQQADYGDKAAKFLSDKYAPGKTTDKQRESATDGIRSMFEKLTGKKVSSKFSN